MRIQITHNRRLDSLGQDATADDRATYERIISEKILRALPELPRDTEFVFEHGDRLRAEVVAGCSREEADQWNEPQVADGEYTSILDQVANEAADAAFEALNS